VNLGGKTHNFVTLISVPTPLSMYYAALNKTLWTERRLDWSCQ